MVLAFSATMLDIASAQVVSSGSAEGLETLEALRLVIWEFRV